MFVAIARDVGRAVEFFAGVEAMKEGSKSSFARAYWRVLQLGEVDAIFSIARVEQSDFGVDIFVGVAEELVGR